MIPKVIHYCWFGKNQLPDLAKKCIESWKKYFPGYEIKEWNEANFDLNCCDYIKEAYSAKKWAFVSDYARFWILYHEGGIYFDTDVEVIHSFKEVIDKGAFIGCETLDRCAPGLGLGAEPGLKLFKEIIDFYNKKHFLKESGEPDTTTVGDYVTHILESNGWIPNGNVTEIEGITIYPPEYFSPINYFTGHISITDNTLSIHHYMGSWHTKTDDKIAGILRFCTKHFGIKKGKKIARIIDFPFRIQKKANTLGVIGMLRFAFQKCKGRKNV